MSVVNSRSLESSPSSFVALLFVGNSSLLIRCSLVRWNPLLFLRFVISYLNQVGVHLCRNYLSH